MAGNHYHPRPNSTAAKRAKLMADAQRSGLSGPAAIRWVDDQMRSPARRTPEDSTPPRQLFGRPPGEGGS